LGGAQKGSPQGQLHRYPPAGLAFLFFYNVLAGDSPFNDPDLASLIKAQQSELDENKRAQLVYDATRAADEKMYYVPLTYTTTILMTQPWVQNFWPADSYNFGTESFAFASINK
jgi:ABC-type transport system substrate-binding protein